MTQAGRGHDMVDEPHDTLVNPITEEGESVAASRDVDPRVGTVLAGTWHLRRLVGTGGAAAVYAAVDQHGLNPVAVKILHPQAAAQEEIRVRFVRESKVANTIPHPGVVRVLETGTSEDDCPFLVMELLEGESYEARWERKGMRLPLEEVLWVGDQVLSILHAAHGRGVVHRDVKPENIYLTNERRVVLLDFGIAGLSDAATASATRMGSVMGTPAFMPPEQARGDWTHVGVQTDLWAVGATMFTLLSGRLVHEEGRLYEQLQAAVTLPAASLADVVPGTPTPIVNLVDHALAFDSARRWPSARAMQSALRLAYSEWRTRDGDGPVPDEDVEMTDRVVRLEKPDAPPPSLRRPGG